MEHNRYWAERFEQLSEAELKKADALSAEMIEEYRRTTKAINDDIERWYARFAAENKMSLADARRILNARELQEFRWTVEEYIKYGEANGLSGTYTQQLKNASARVHIDRLEALRYQLAHHIEKLAAKSNTRLTEVLQDIYPDAHLKTAYEVQKKKGFDAFSRIPEADVERILKKPWVSDGQNFSDRIWRDKEKLLQVLQGELTRGLIRGESYASMTKRIVDRMHVSIGAASRLVETEAAFFSTRGQMQAFKDLGVEEYEFVATLDSRTSEKCRDMDGKVLPLRECKPGITAPPLHCRCRSTICPHFDDEFTKGETRAARDPKTGKTVQIPSNMKYEDWKKVYVDKSMTLEEWQTMNVASKTADKEVLKGGGGNDRMGHLEKKDVSPVHLLCKLNKTIYSIVEANIQSDNVIITDERIEHIRQRHPSDYESIIGYIPQIIATPDYIIAASKPHTAVVLKMIEEDGQRFKVILRLKVEGDPSKYENSIISFWIIGETTWKKTLRNKDILYKRE